MKIDHEPTCYNATIADTKEKAFQRAIIGARNADLDGGSVEWIDIELPVTKGKSDRFDLIGIDLNDRYVLCELKFSKNGSNGGDPGAATEQVRGYLNELRTYLKELKDNEMLFKLHKNANRESLNIDGFLRQTPRLVVAANSEYWEQEAMSEFMPAEDVEYYSVNIASNEFDRQKGELDQYKPIMPSDGKSWHRVGVS